MLFGQTSSLLCMITHSYCHRLIKELKFLFDQQLSILILETNFGILTKMEWSCDFKRKFKYKFVLAGWRSTCSHLRWGCKYSFNMYAKWNRSCASKFSNPSSRVSVQPKARLMIAIDHWIAWFNPPKYGDIVLSGNYEEKLTNLEMNPFVASVVQWQNSRLPRGRPGFDSPSMHLLLYNQKNNDFFCRKHMPPPGIEPGTFRSSVWRSPNWAIAAIHVRCVVIAACWYFMLIDKTNFLFCCREGAVLCSNFWKHLY